MPKVEKSTSQRIVDLLRDAPEGLTRDELAEKIGLPLPSVRRDVGALIAGGVAAENGRRKNKDNREVGIVVLVKVAAAPPPPPPVKVEIPVATGIKFAPADGPFERRFWSLVDKQAPSAPGGEPCWPWKGPINSEGQGVFLVAGQPVRAKRLAVELARGEPIGDLHVGACKTSRLCLNPAHLGVKVGHKPGQKREGSAEDPRQASLFKFPCPKEGCAEGFDRRGDLARHVQDAHAGTPDPGELSEAEARAADPRPPDLPAPPPGMKVG